MTIFNFFMPRHTIHTTLSENAFKLLDKYMNMKNDRGELVYGNQSKVIEFALNLLDKYYHPAQEDLQTIWNRARTELNMLLVGKATYLAYLSGNVEKAFEHNVAIDILEWYARKPIHELSCREILEALKNIWIAANYFYKVEIQEQSNGGFEVSFYHDMHEERYSEFWGKYFATFIERHSQFTVEILPRNSYFRLSINPK